MAETRTGVGRRWALSRRSRNGSRGLSGALSFAELVRAHDRWERQVEAGAVDPLADGNDDYHQRLQRFEHAEGKILGAYWCTTAASAIVLTVKESAGRLQPFRHLHTRIHRLSDWVIPRNGEPIAELLHHCDTLAIKASSVLTGTPARIVMHWIFAIES